jgi:MoxR-like ATPase
MQTLNLDGVAGLIQHVCIKLNRPLMVIGRSGAGKTAIGNAVTKRLNSVTALDALLGEANNYTGCILEPVLLSQYESVDLRGFPGVNRETGFTVWHAPSTLPFVGNDKFPDDKIIILFLDELTSAQPSVASVAYQLINERRIGEHMLKPNVRILAAGNKDDDQGATSRMPKPLCNRMTWAEALVDHNVWTKWAHGQGVHPIIIAFIHFKPDLLMTYDPKKAEKVFATQRTWEAAAEYFVDDMPDDLKWAAISGAIGAGPSAELNAFVSIWQKVTPIKDIIADPDGVPVPTEASMCYATAVSVAGAMSAKTIAPLHVFIKRMKPEMVVLAWKLASMRDPKLHSTPEFLDVTKRYRSVFNL